MKRAIVAGALVVLGSVVPAVQALEITDARAANITEIVELPIKNLKAIETNGQIVFVSDNGRFVISGELTDIWSRKKLSSMAQMRDAATRLHFKEMGLELDALNTLSLGQGDKEVAVFVDPQCSACHQLITEAEGLLDQYTFKFVVVPALGDVSNQLAKQVFCANDKSEALTAFRENKIPQLSQRSNCDMKQYDQTLLTAHLIGIQGVPFVVSPDGRQSKGRPADLKAWLEDAS